jgi:hypothetical protein
MGGGSGDPPRKSQSNVVALQEEQTVKTFERSGGCACCGLSRRKFLAAGGAVCAGALGLAAAPRLLGAEQGGGKVRVRIIYSLHAAKQPGPDWPNKGFDFVPVMDRINGELAKRCPGFEFVASLAQGPEQAKKIVEEDQAAAVDGYLVYQMNCWNRVVQTVAATARLRCERTPKPGDLACKPDALKTLSPEECLRRMKESKILAVRSQEAGPAAPIMEIPMENVSFAEVNEAWKAADKDRVREVADRWQKTAASIVDVSRETLETSAAMYLGMKAVLKTHGANAITINCLGGFYGGHIHAYPCLGFHELNNEGLVGACECDVRSTATMTAISALAQGRPGTISDPVIDTAKRQIIYAHCVAPNRVFGPQGEANPFHILTHSEDRQGASVRSILPTGYLTTTLEVRPDRKEILFHQGKAVANDPDDRACRTKLCAEPLGDIEKLFTEWDQWGWHRVTFYGDLKEPVQALAAAMGWKIVAEA